MTFVFPNMVPAPEVVAGLPAGPLRLWLDDDLVDRPAPDGWVHVTTVAQAVVVLATGRVVEVSLDNDLSDDERFGRGVEVVDFLCEASHDGRPLWPERLTIHSANAPARDQMARAVERYAAGRARRTLTAGGKTRFEFA